MVPLIMSASREENPTSAFEEFGTHLSLYDDSFLFVEKLVPATSSPSPVVEDSQGPLPPSVFYPLSKNSEDASGQVKVKRKCGRPRNPIPRHKRESHINAEHRRRGKIQDGFRTLKGMVPKYEQSSGRDSKADILFKAVDYCKLLQNDINELGSSMEALRAERDVISMDIKNYKTVVPDLSLYDELSISLDDRYTDYVQSKSKENWTFGTFKVIMRPLFESYKLCVRGESLGEFMRSVADWASNSLSLSNLRTVCLTTLKDVPSGFADADQFKVGHSGHGAASPTDKSTISDSNNNNRCLGNHALTSELFGSQSLAANTNRTGWNRNAEVEVNDHSFSSRGSPMSKGGPPSNMQSSDLVSFAGGNLEGSNIFGDMYYNLGNDLHHHQLSLARSSVNHWPNFHFRQQFDHYYPNSHLPSSRHGSDFRESHHFWGNQHQQLSQHLVGDHNMAPGHYQQQVYPLPEREVRYELTSSREGFETQPASISHLSHSTRFLEPDLCRRKRLSQSSSESDGSLLNMDLFARKATETLVEHEKLSQLSPSTDSCVSSGSSAYGPSPGVFNGRSADFACLYRSVSSQDSFKQTRPVNYERLDSFDSQLALSSSTYREVFTVGTAELPTNSVNRLEENHKNYVNSLNERLKTYMDRNDYEARPALCATNCRQPSSERLSSGRPDSSSLLAEMLGQQQSALQQTWSSHSCVDSRGPAPAHPHTTAGTVPVPAANLNKSTELVNQQVKGERTHAMSSPVKHPDDYMPGKNQHSPSLGNPSSSFHPHSKEIQKHFSALDMKNAGVPASVWSNPNPKSQTTPDFTANPKLKLERKHSLTGSPNPASYFEIAHQKLLQNHFYSTNNRKDEVHLPDLIKPKKDSGPIPKQEKGMFVSNMSTGANIPTAPAQSSEFLDKSSGLILPPQTYSAFMEPSLRHKIGRKSPLEDGYLEGGKLEVISGSKKLCQRRESLKTSPRLLMARQYVDSETITEM